MTAVLLNERPAPGIAVLTLNRPQAMNAIDRALTAALRTALAELAADDEVAVVILAGAGERAFCAGVDLKERQGWSDAEAAAFRHDELFPMYRELDAFDKPLIAAVHGVAIGGGFELALCCDLLVAAEGATFALPEVRWGMIPAAGGCGRLAQAIGAARAKELILTATSFDAATALGYGIVNRVVARERCLAVALELAGQIAVHPPLAVRGVMRSVDAVLAARAASEHDVAIADACYADPVRKARIAGFGSPRAGAAESSMRRE